MTPVEQVHALWAAFASGGALATLDHLDDDCEWLPAEGFPDARAIRGGAALHTYLEQLTDDGIEIEPTLHRCEAVGEHVVAAGRIRIVSPTALSDSPLFWLYRMRNGRVARVESYLSRRAALDAAAA